MSIYFLKINNVSKKNGSSAIASLAYQTGEKISYKNKIYNYKRKERVVFSETLIPQNADSTFLNSVELFSKIENYESKNSDAQLAKRIKVALPREFDFETSQKVLQNYCSLLTKNGYGCTYSIHTDRNNNNPHAHILVGARRIDTDKNFKTKYKKEFVRGEENYVLDKNGNRIPLIDKETKKQKVDDSGNLLWRTDNRVQLIDEHTGLPKIGKRNEILWKRVNVVYNIIDDREFFKKMRSHWADCCNEYLEQSKQISEKSNRERDIPFIPYIHEGHLPIVAELKHEHNLKIGQKNKQIQEKIDNERRRIEELKEVEQAERARTRQINARVTETKEKLRDIEETERQERARAEELQRQLEEYRKREVEVRTLRERIEVNENEQREERERAGTIAKTINNIKATIREFKSKVENKIRELKNKIDKKYLISDFDKLICEHIISTQCTMKEVCERFGVSKQEVKNAMSAYEDYVSNKEFIDAMQNNELIETEQNSTQGVEIEEEKLTAPVDDLDATDELEPFSSLFPVVDRRQKVKSREELLSSAREHAHQINNSRDNDELRAKIKHNFGR